MPTELPATHASGDRPRVLVTAGPTEEPIDEVRFIGNRSSGRMGIEIARAFADAGCGVTLLLGPIRGDAPVHSRITCVRFRTAAELAGGSEERRVGKECNGQCRSRWSPYH